MGLGDLASPDYQAMAIALQDAGWTVKPPPLPPPVRKCYACEVTDEDDYLTEFTAVTCGQGHSEGYDHRTLYACEYHFDDLADGLRELGFKTHYHGSITFLEDEECPGKNGKECPTPEVKPYERRLFHE